MYKQLTKSEARIVRAIGQTMYPRDKKIPVDAIDAGVVEYLDEFLDRCPPVQRVQLKALFRGIDLGYAVYAGHPSARFVDADAEDRTSYLEGWGQSEFYLRRMAFDGLKVVFNLAYIDSPIVLAHTGIRTTSAGPAENRPAVDENAKKATG